MNRVTKEIDYPIMEMTISLHSALNCNVIEQIRKETKLIPRYLHSVRAPMASVDLSDIFIVMEITVPARAEVSFPTELQRASC